MRASRRQRFNLMAAVAALLAVPLSAGATTPPATWTYDDPAAEAGSETTLTVTLQVEDDGLDPNRPLGYRHFLLGADSTPLTGLEVDWEWNGESGTAVVDDDGAILVPDRSFRLTEAAALLSSGDEQTLTMTFEDEGDVFVFSDLVELDPVTRRLFGSNRYATAAAASAATHEPGVDVVYVASGAAFADALSAGPAAAHRGGPLLLTQPDALPEVTRRELRRLRPDEIVLVGGTSAVSERVELDLNPYASEVRRISGIDRFDTAARVARDGWLETGTESVYVANGRSFADALGAAAAAGVRDVPILLVEVDSIPNSTKVSLDVLEVESITVAGGPAAVNELTYASLRSRVGSANRRFGPDRYATSAALADRPGDGRALVIATGSNFPDALTAGPLSAMLNADFLLVRSDEVPESVAERATELAPRRLTVLGGPGAVAQSVADQIDDLRTPMTPLYRDPLVCEKDSEPDTCDPGTKVISVGMAVPAP